METLQDQRGQNNKSDVFAADVIDESEEDDSYYDEEQESRSDKLTVIHDVADYSVAASTVRGGLEKKTEATLICNKAEANICTQSPNDSNEPPE